MAAEYQRQESLPASSALCFDERLLMLTQAEADSRYDKKVTRLFRRANLRESEASFEEIDFSPARKLERAAVARLSDLRWIRQGRNMLITGSCGTGKTYLASAFGAAACRLGLSVKALRATRLFVDLQIGRGDGSWSKLLEGLKKPDLLILDDFGLANLEIIHCRDFLEVVDERQGRGSILIASQLPVGSWHNLFADPTIADAVLDRLLDKAERIELSGPSKRGVAAGKEK
jgi:DNA replication protein DnaC